MTGTFFGHRDTPQWVEPLLQAALKELIENRKVTSFYVGNQGAFDRMARRTLKRLKGEYPLLECEVVLAYIPVKRLELEDEYGFETICPEGIENTPPRYAIAKRNRWMLDRSDYVLTYVKYTSGNAARLKEMAERRGKEVLNLADWPRPSVPPILS